MNFSFEIQGSAMTGSISPTTLDMITGMVGMFFGGLAMIWLIVYIAIIVFMIIARWRVFEKAGLPGRGILIPIYNRVLMFQLGGMSGRRAASILFPPLFIVMMIINYFRIAERFGKHRTFGLGILFIRIVFIPILAFDRSKYLAKKTVEKTENKPVTKKSAVKKTPAKKVVAKKAPVKKVKTLKKKK